jgi:type II secretory pathway pseudopilin PulG
MEFVRHNKPLITLGSIIVLFLVAAINSYLFIIVPIQSQGNPSGYVDTPSLVTSNQEVVPTVPASPTTEMSQANIIALLIVLLIALLAMVILVALLKHASSQRRKRDQQRRQDLKVIAQGFEAFKQVHGSYPLSTTYQPEYYTAINLSNDWNYYGLPKKDQMVRYIPNWPVSDPALKYMDKNQVNQYLYYPQENGRRYALYAHLEAPLSGEAIDYNQQDNLLRAWGTYNYKIESGQETAAVAQDSPPIADTTPTTSATNPDATAQTVTTDRPTPIEPAGQPATNVPSATLTPSEVASNLPQPGPSLAGMPATPTAPPVDPITTPSNETELELPNLPPPPTATLPDLAPDPDTATDDAPPLFEPDRSA